MNIYTYIYNMQSYSSAHKFAYDFIFLHSKIASSWVDSWMSRQWNYVHYTSARNLAICIRRFNALSYTRFVYDFLMHFGMLQRTNLRFVYGASTHICIRIRHFNVFRIWRFDVQTRVLLFFNAFCTLQRIFECFNARTCDSYSTLQRI